MNSELISVIVPIYNVEQYVEQCIESIIRQTYKNIEIICVDDKSPDNSIKICEQMALMDSRIKIIYRNENGGLSAARNTGIEEANGEYIAFVDSDDWVSEDYLEVLYSMIKNNKADIAQASYARTTISNIGILQDDEIYVREMTGIEAFRFMYNTISYQPSVNYTVVWNKLYKKNVLKDIKFPEGKIFEDQYFTPIVFYQSKRVVVTNKKVYFYRKNYSGITAQKYNLRFQDELEMHLKQYIYFKEKGEKELMDIVLARYMPLAINHYIVSIFHKNKDAKKNAYFKVLKMLPNYLKNKKVRLYYKLYILLFAIWPPIFVGFSFDVKYREVV